MIKRYKGSVQTRSRAVAHAGLVYTVATAKDKSGDLYAQTKDVLAQIDATLAEAGTNKSRILRATVYIIDMNQKSEMDRAVFEWRRQFRGDVQIKDATAITDADIAGSNLILWGDPQSNPLLAKIAAKLPLQWTKDAVIANGKTHASAGHAPVMVYPNPLNGSRYIVINSSFTYREYDYLNNARQVAKLPDWAIVDLSQPPNSRAPGKIADAGFFDEKWQWKPEKK